MLSPLTGFLDLLSVLIKYRLDVRKGIFLERALGRSGVERYFVEAGAAEGVFERGGILGVVVDYCHDSDRRGGRKWGG